MNAIKSVLLWVYNFLWVLVHPTYWVQNESSDKYLDEWYQEGLDQGEVFTIISNYRAMFRGKEVWIEGHPYSSFSVGRYPTGIPSRRIRAKLQAIVAPLYLEYRLDLLNN